MNHSPELDDVRLQTSKKNLLLSLGLLATDFRERVRRGLWAEGHNLHPSHSSVLVHLSVEGSRPTELAERAGMSKQAMGKIIDELCEIGYVKKAADPRDGRARIICFTDKGLALLSDSAGIIDGIWQDYAQLIGEDRLAELRDNLTHLRLAVREDSRQKIASSKSRRAGDILSH